MHFASASSVACVMDSHVYISFSLNFQSLCISSSSYAYSAFSGELHSATSSYLLIDLSCNYATTNTVFKLGIRTTLNGMNFMFVSHGLFSEKQNILLEHMHKKEFWILTKNLETILNTKTRLRSHGYSASFSVFGFS